MVKRRFVVDLLISPKEKMIHGRQINSMEGAKIFAGWHKNLNIVPPLLGPWKFNQASAPLSRKLYAPLIMMIRPKTHHGLII